ncbi:NAD(P)/FAD-dependent oxidoreductase [Kribbella sp. CA-294648]|uniref:NAD(P)/FAD-dependent oxidoreductase n=1 Tax=Kribbella sp. CA-294648 TaxID=3239948 RepID=UPI003D8ABE9D
MEKPPTVEQRGSVSDLPTFDVAILGGGVAGLTLALELHKELPHLDVAIIERNEHPVPETTHKVGESTVEIAAHYLRDRLGLADHLDQDQLRKFGLRMFFTGHGNSDITQRVELGSSIFAPLTSYQLDRGRLENELGRRCAAAGVHFLSGHSVDRIALDPGEAPHSVTLSGPAGQRTLQAQWIVDASGRAQLLRRHLKLNRTKVGHSANAAWFRVAHPLDVEEWTQDPSWAQRISEGERALSTNHLMGSGYWVWLIRLATGATSVGIVAGAEHHDFSTFNTLERALGFLSEHEPQCAKAVVPHIDKIKDFRVMRDYSYSCDKVFSGQQRWCMTGESGVFLDPLYSPGLDLIAISNGLVVDLLRRSGLGQDVGPVADLHDILFLRLTNLWLATYENQYGLMGNAQVMSSKVIWDTAFYWAVFGLLFFQDKFREVGSTPSIAETLEELSVTSNRMQQFFREWDGVGNSELDPQFIDLLAPIEFMLRLHSEMTDDLTPAQFEQRFRGNAEFLAQLAGQLMNTVIRACAERLDEASIEQVQAWQRDEHVSHFVATFRRERLKNPTTDRWIPVGSPRANCTTPS